ncbi:MAG: glutamate racemase [Clostridia bacterium]|nr:glutamate racemase [Clostridia bacterium]
MSREDQIGVFDSGVGGISVLAALEALLPGERFLYYGDTLNAPYGTKTEEEVFRCVSAVFSHLLEANVKAVVIACNTATAVAAQQLRTRWPDLPIIAMEPALKPAALLRGSGRILVLATPMTLRLEKFHRLMETWGDAADPVPCPGLMELVEQQDEAGAQAYLRRVLADCRKPLDAVVLGCTHYVFLRPLLRQLLPPQTAILDGNAGTARQLRRVLTAADLLRREAPGEIRLETSGDPRTVLPLMETLLAQARVLAREA